MNLSLQPFVEAALEIGAEATYDDQAAVNVSKSIVLKDFIDLVDIDNNGPAYYYYKGSLTTPGCNEVVSWIVMENTISISEYQVRHSNSLQASYQKFGEAWYFQIVNFQKLQAVQNVSTTAGVQTIFLSHESTFDNKDFHLFHRLKNTTSFPI